MKAIVQTKYGSPDEVLDLRQVDKPVTGDDEVLIRVHAASVHPDVWHVVRGFPYVLRLMGAGLRTPKHRIPGTDMAGHVDSVGKNVTRFHPGDAVFGECVEKHQWTNGGNYAEWVSVREGALAHKPANVTFEQAAAVPTSGLIALRVLREEGRIQAGQTVLINGAGGGVGSLAVQIAKSYGTHVTGVDTGRKLEMIRSLGADRVIDYTKEDFTRSGERYDLIFDVASNLSLSDCKRALTRDGTFALVGHDHFGTVGRRWFGSIPRFMGLQMMAPFVRCLKGRRKVTDAKLPLAVLQELLEAGQITPHIDRTFPMSEACAAIRYLVEGHPLGKVVLTV